MYGDESIYNLIPYEYTVRERSPQRISKKSHKSQEVTGSTFGCRGTTRLPGAGRVEKKDGALFGRNPALAREIAPIIKREQEATKRAMSRKFKYEDTRKPIVPDRRERPIMGIKTSKNFITANAVEAILQVPKSIEVGELNYMKKEDFGKVPDYLYEVREEIRRENEMIDKYVKEQMGQVEEEPDQYDEISDGERGALVTALKDKWDTVNATYQKLTHLTLLDTAGQIRRKETLETAMTALENDINQLQRPGPLLIRK